MNNATNSKISPNMIHIMSCKIHDLIEYSLMLHIQRKYNEDGMPPSDYIRILDESQNHALNIISDYRPTIDYLAGKIAEHYILRHPHKKSISGDSLENYTEDAIETSPEFASAFETLLSNIIREFD